MLCVMYIFCGIPHQSLEGDFLILQVLYRDTLLYVRLWVISLSLLCDYLPTGMECQLCRVFVKIRIMVNCGLTNPFNAGKSFPGRFSTL